MEIVFTFAATSHAILAEQTLLSAGVEVFVMPLPSAVRAGCGLCLRIVPQSFTTASTTLELANVPVQQVYTRTVLGGKSTLKPYKGEELS